MNLSILFVVVVWTVSIVGFAQDRQHRFDKWMEKLVDTREIIGGVAMVQRGESVYLKAVGFQDEDEGIPMSTNSIFRLCSMTKPITSVAAMILIEEGYLSLYDDVAKYIPEFGKPKVLELCDVCENGYQIIDASSSIKIVHLLTHSSGLIYPPLEGSILGPIYGHVSSFYHGLQISSGIWPLNITNEENVRRIAQVPLVSHPGTQHHYGVSTDVLGRVIEVITGQSLEDFFKERIFEPLNMKDTMFSIPKDDERLSRLSTLYYRSPVLTVFSSEQLKSAKNGPEDLQNLQWSHTRKPLMQSGGAGLLSTIEDYNRFLQMIARKGELDGVRILSRKTISWMLQNRMKQQPFIYPFAQYEGDGFSLGFGIEQATSQHINSPGAAYWTGAYLTSFFVDINDGTSATFLTQVSGLHGSMFDTYPYQFKSLANSLDD